MTLTTSGRVLYQEATSLIAHAQRVVEVMAGARTGSAGTLFLGCVPTALFGALPAIVGTGQGGLGDLTIRLTEAHTAEIIASVLDGSIDAGIVWEDRAPPKLAIRPLEPAFFIAALHSSHALSAAKRVSLADLAGDPLVVSPREVTPHQFDRIQAGFQAAGLSPTLGQQARSIVAQLGFVASGMGYALVPGYARKLAITGVTFVPLREKVESAPLSLIWDERRASSQLAAFRQLVDAAFPLGERVARTRKKAYS